MSGFLKCKNCKWFCKTCVGAAGNCMSCKSGSFRFGPNCICIDGYYSEGTTVQCKTCANQCKKCANGTSCSACKDGTRNPANFCKCPDKFYEHSVTKCKSCLRTCQTCTEASKCTSCVNSTPSRSGNQCACPNGFYDNGSADDCKDCLFACAKCTNGTSCSQCKTSSPNREGSKCVCPAKYYDDGTNSQCQNCLGSCATCLNGTQCQTCLPSNPSREGNKCECPDKYWDSGADQCQSCLKGCQTCNNGTSCQSCVTSTPARQGSKCECPAKFYDNGSDADCKECLSGCQTCNNGTQCQSCKNSTPSRQGSKCLCPSKYFDDGSSDSCQTCLSSCATCNNATSCQSCVPSTPSRTGSKCECPAGFYDDGSDDCKECMRTCITCSNGTSCDTCKASSPARIKANKCGCPDEYYDDGSNDQCKPCKWYCKTCDNGTTCLTCKTSSTVARTGSNCDCPNRYYSTTNQVDCKPCARGCLTCNNSNNCQSCYSSTPARLMNKCECPQNFYDNNTDDDCKDCKWYCATCNNSTNCQTCVSSTPSRSGANCDCPTKYYSQTNINQCQQCLWQCKTCNNGTSCQTCVDSTIQRIGAQCKCPEKYYTHNQEPECRNCLPGCQSCDNGTSCQSCKTSSPSRQGSTCTCPDKYYDDGNTDQCQDCLWYCSTCDDNTKCTGCVNSTPARAGDHCVCPNRYWTQTNVDQCQNCLVGCEKCVNATECTECKASTPARITNKCICPIGWYDDGVSDDCQKCLWFCISCVNGHECTQCQNSTPARLATTCDCPNRWYSDPEPSYQCLQCQQHGCETCDDASKCTSCKFSTPSRINNDCVCPQKFYDNLSDDDCKDCLWMCATCVNGSQCQTCVTSTPPRTGTMCICPDRYFTIVNTDQCQDCLSGCQKCTQVNKCTQCKASTPARITQQCTCIDRYYDDTINDDCQNCLVGCEKCVNGTECTQCKTSTPARITDQCICPEQYYDDGVQDSCQECIFGCKTCLDGTSCETCDPSTPQRIQADQCKCPEEFYDDFTNSNCQFCQDRNPACITCTFDKCLTCIHNRVKLDPGSLDCLCIQAQHMVEHAHTLWCSTCTEAVYTSLFSEDYAFINLSFDIEIYTPDFDNYDIPSKSLCEYVLDPSILPLLGDIPLCRIANKDPIWNFEIKLGRAPTITENDDVILIPNKIQWKNQHCIDNTLLLNTFPFTTVQRHPNSYKPNIQLKKPTGGVSLCEDISIQIKKIENDGGRGLFNFQWTLRSHDSPSPQKLQQIIQQNNSKKLSFLNIPALTLTEYSTYKINLKFENFLGEQSEQTFDLSSLSSKGTSVFIQTVNPFSFKTWKRNEIPADIKYLDCSNGSLEQVEQPLDITWTDITTPSTPKQIKKYISDPKDTQSILVLDPYTQTIDTTYIVEITVDIQGQSGLSSSQFIEYYIEISPLVAFIEGGNRLHAYAQELNLKAIGKDPDVPEELQQDNLEKQWSCINLKTQAPCETIAGDLLQFNQTNQATFGAKLFEPYDSYRYEYYIKKPSKNNAEQIGTAIMIIVETDLPMLEVQVPEVLLVQKINKNDDLQIDVAFSGDIDEVFFSLIILYKYEVVKTKSFEYSSFAFKIWDLFNDFRSDEISFMLRVSMYDPQYFMPSQTNFQANINFEPMIGIMKIEPLSGISLDTQFLIELTGFFDEDQPLSYKYQFYQSRQDYEQERELGNSPVSLKKNLLKDFTNENSLLTYLPKGNLDGESNKYELLIMVSVSDSLGAIANVTQVIEVQSNPDFSQHLTNIDQKIQEIDTMSIENSIDLLNILANDLANQGVQDCMNNCSGNGECDLQDKICLCQSDYFLQDCSQNDLTLWDKFAQLQKKIYDKLKTLEGKTSSKSVEDQVLKSLNILLQGNDLGTQLNEQDLDNNLNDIDSLIEKQQKELKILIDNGLINSGDNLSSRKFGQINEILGKSIQNLDATLESIQVLDTFRRRRRRLLQDTNTTNNNQIKVVDLAKKTTETFQRAQLPNSDMLEFKGKNMVSKIGKHTTKKIEQQYFAPQDNQVVKYFTDDQLDKNNNDGESQNSSSNKQKGISSSFDANQQNLNNNQNLKNLIYKSSVQSFRQNPYINDPSYPYPDQNNVVSDIDIIQQQQINNDGENNQEQNIQQQEEEDIQILQPVFMQFQPAGDKIDRNKCISKSKTGEWKDNKCDTLEVESDLGELQIECQCLDLSPATVIEDLENMFENSLAKEVFSDQGISALADFKFWESFIFYIFVGKTIIIILAILNGKSRDRAKYRLLKEQVQTTQCQQEEDENSEQQNQDDQSKNGENSPTNSIKSSLTHNKNQNNNDMHPTSRKDQQQFSDLQSSRPLTSLSSQKQVGNSPIVHENSSHLNLVKNQEQELSGFFDSPHSPQLSQRASSIRPHLRKKHLQQKEKRLSNFSNLSSNPKIDSDDQNNTPINSQNNIITTSGNILQVPLKSPGIQPSSPLSQKSPVSRQRRKKQNFKDFFDTKSENQNTNQNNDSVLETQENNNNNQQQQQNMAQSQEIIIPSQLEIPQNNNDGINQEDLEDNDIPCSPRTPSIKLNNNSTQQQLNQEPPKINILSQPGDTLNNSSSSSQNNNLSPNSTNDLQIQSQLSIQQQNSPSNSQVRKRSRNSHKRVFKDIPLQDSDPEGDNKTSISTSTANNTTKRKRQSNRKRVFENLPLVDPSETNSNMGHSSQQQQPEIQDIQDVKNNLLSLEKHNNLQTETASHRPFLLTQNTSQQSSQSPQDQLSPKSNTSFNSYTPSATTTKQVKKKSQEIHNSPFATPTQSPKLEPQQQNKQPKKQDIFQQHILAQKQQQQNNELDNSKKSSIISLETSTVQKQTSDLTIPNSSTSTTTNNFNNNLLINKTPSEEKNNGRIDNFLDNVSQSSSSEDEIKHNKLQTNKLKSDQEGRSLKHQQSSKSFVKPIPPSKLRNVSEGIIRLHNFFGIFIIFDKEISRPIRFVLYYVRITLLIAISGIFSQRLNEVQSVLLSIISIILTEIPLKICSKLFKSKKCIANLLAIILTMALQLLGLYTALTTAAVMGVDESNAWVWTYTSSFCMDSFFLDPVKTCFKLSYLKKALIKGKKNCLVSLLKDKELLDFLKDKIKD